MYKGIKNKGEFKGCQVSNSNETLQQHFSNTLQGISWKGNWVHKLEEIPKA
jgi:hypothetical protein